MLVRPAMKRLFCMKEKMASVASLPRPCLIITVFFCESLHCYVVLVFILNHSFYVPTTSAVPPVSSLIFHPRKIEVLWSQTVREKNRTLKNQGRQIKCERTGYESTTENVTWPLRTTSKHETNIHALWGALICTEHCSKKTKTNKRADTQSLWTCGSNTGLKIQCKILKIERGIAEMPFFRNYLIYT